MKKILIANRGEIACRIIRACKEMGYQTVAVYSSIEKEATHVQMADEAFLVGVANVKDSYLNIEKILEAAKTSKADAIHPGYGLLSENAAFADACAEANLTFIGPSASLIRKMGNKIEARKIMSEAGVPVVPGESTSIEGLPQAGEIAAAIGYPVMIKAASGGGGIGMAVAYDQEELEKQFEGNQKRAQMFFGEGSMYIEKYIEQPRHIEIQVMADSHGNVLHLGERDCSIQRRHQKVVEECPSPFITEEVRKQMGNTAVKAAKHIGYENAGTMEFLVDKDHNFYFLEMNTRLQVEHTVTEEVYGVDIVHWQLKIAEGEILDITTHPQGHSMQVRIYAEDPVTFFPSPGTITKFTLPQGDRVRNETGIQNHTKITPYYDPMIAKLIVSADTREQTIEKMIEALQSYEIEGIKTNIPMLLQVLRSETFQDGEVTTAFVKEILPTLST